MKMLVLMLIVSLSVLNTDGWKLFERVTFKARYNKLYNQYFQYPEFDSAIRAQEGKDIILQGHYVPYDLAEDNSIMLSRYPFAACFFCGGAGPESVAEVVFTGKKPKLKVDDFIQVKGKLKLNDKDELRMTFIVEQASIIKE